MLGSSKWIFFSTNAGEKRLLGHYHSSGNRDKSTIQRRVRLQTKTAIRGDCGYSLGSSNLVVHCPSSSRRIRRSDAAEDLFDVVNEALAVSRGRIDPAKRSGSTSLRGDRKDYYRNDRPSKTTTVNVYDRSSKTTAVSTVAKGYCKRLGQRLLLLLIKPFS